MNIEPRLLVYDGYEDVAYISLNCAIFQINKNKKIIDLCMDVTGNDYSYLISTDNQQFKLEDLKCKTFDELLISLEIHSLLHGINENLDDKSTSDKYKNILIENRKLKEENEKLNKKFLKLKKLFND